MTQLKHFFSRELVADIAASISRVHPSFDSASFTQRATSGLEDLELMDRARQIAGAMADFLPASYPEATRIIVASLGSEHSTDELLGAGMAPFFYLPHTIYVADHGLEHFDLSMEVQHALTRRFSAEGSIRAFIDRDPERAWSWFERWVEDPNAHVRRLVSEGTRIRLPWARRVRWLEENRARVITLLERLRDDPSTMVRRSVANNLNDIAKLDPDLVVKTCTRWSRGANAARRKLLEHAMRTVVKRGHPGALALLGYGNKPGVKITDIAFRPRVVTIGSNAVIEFRLTNTSAAGSDLLVDLVVHFVKASGKSSPKVFKMKRVELGRRETVTLSKTVSFAKQTTRIPRPGRHLVEVSVNGERFPLGDIQVKTAKA